MDGITDLMDMSLSKHREMVKDKEAWRAAVHAVTELEMTEGLNSNMRKDNAQKPTPRRHR